MYYDIAVLYVNNSEILRNANAVAVTFADSDKVSVGDTAIAIGNAKGEGISASNGIVSVDSEHITMIAPDDTTEVDYRVMRIDTAVNSGNSGGGLFNSNGQLIGIVNAKIIDEGVENIGYAIPSNIALAVTNNLIDHCYGTNVETVQRCLLGITITISDSTAVIDDETGKLLIRETVTIHEVTKSSVAKGRLQADDILLSISINGNKRSITRQHHVIDYMLDARVGDNVTFEFERNGEILSTTVTITELCVTPY
jgi:S1-C subfamily serine protease